VLALCLRCTGVLPAPASPAVSRGFHIQRTAATPWWPPRQSV